MDAKAHDLNFVLGQKQHWVVPVYQRHYEWDTAQDKQLPKLWDGRTIEPPVRHFLQLVGWQSPSTV